MVTHATESWAAFEPEFRGLMGGHWDEVGLGCPLDFDWDAYREADTVLVASRAEGVLVGYAVGRIGKHPYLGDGVGAADFYYLHPAYRLGRVGLHLLAAFEGELRSRGAKSCYLGVSLRHDHGVLLQHLNYKPVDTYYFKGL